MISFHNIDCMDFMKACPDKVFDMAIVDTPYGISVTKMSMGTNLNRRGDGYPAESVARRIRKDRLTHGGGKLKNRLLNQSVCDWDLTPPGKEYFDELFRVSKNQIIWGGNYFELPATRGIVVWDKIQPWDNFSQVELAWTSFDVPAKIFHYSNTGGANREKKIHPTQKPVALYKWLLEKFWISGQRILDTHGGSMSIAIAAYDYDANLDICEIDLEYFQNAKKRFDEYTRQMKFNFGATK